MMISEGDIDCGYGGGDGSNDEDDYNGGDENCTDGDGGDGGDAATGYADSFETPSHIFQSHPTLSM